MKDRKAKPKGALLNFPAGPLSSTERPMIVPADLSAGVRAVAKETGYTPEQVLRYMLEESINITRIFKTKGKTG